MTKLARKSLIVIPVLVAVAVIWSRVDEISMPAPLKQVKRWTNQITLPLARPIESESIVETFDDWSAEDLTKEMKRLDEEELNPSVFARLNDGSATEAERLKVRRAFNRKNAMWTRSMELKVKDVEKGVEEAERQHSEKIERVKEELGGDV